MPLLSGLNDGEIVKIADAFEPFDFDDGQTIIRQGEHGDYFYILEKGSATVTKQLNGVTYQMGTLKPGDYFGELALLNDTTRAASVTAHGNVRVIALSKDAFARLMGPLTRTLHHQSALYVSAEKHVFV